jgi:hypothetical protein
MDTQSSQIQSVYLEHPHELYQDNYFEVIGFIASTDEGNYYYEDLQQVGYEERVEVSTDHSLLIHYDHSLMQVARTKLQPDICNQNY